MTPTQRFRRDIEDFLLESGMTPTGFGKKAVKDPNFVWDLEAGRSPNLNTVERVYEFMTHAREGAQ